MASSSLAIIGGGASAALLLIQLGRHGLDKKFSITVFDRSGNFPRGIAYANEFMSHRLNVRAGNMSALHDDPAHFTDWLGAHHPHYGAGDFVPRKIFGDYLAGQMAGLSFTLSEVDVEAVHKAEQYQLFAAGETAAFDEVVIATGNVRPLGPKVLDGAGAYLPDPWDRRRIEAIPKTGKVALIGSGLSAADAVSGLMETDFDGRITVISRNGWFPAVHAAPARHELRGRPPIGEAPSALMKWLRKEIAAAMSAATPWQAVIDALRHATNPAWQGWDERQRGIFLRRAFTLWNIHRHRMSPETAAAIEHYRARGQLEIVMDTVLRVEANRVVCRGQTISADAIINCMGYRYDEGRIFAASHRIGPARFGELFETTAIPEIRAQAAEIAAALSRTV